MKRCYRSIFEKSLNYTVNDFINNRPRHKYNEVDVELRIQNVNIVIVFLFLETKVYEVLVPFESVKESSTLLELCGEGIVDKVLNIIKTDRSRIACKDFRLRMKRRDEMFEFLENLIDPVSGVETAAKNPLLAALLGRELGHMLDYELFGYYDRELGNLSDEDKNKKIFEWTVDIVMSELDTNEHEKLR